MKEFMTLLKMQLNVNVGISALRYRLRRERDKVGQTLAIGVTVAILLIGLVFLYTMLMNAIYFAGLTVGNPQIVLVTAILGLQLFLLFTGIFYVLGVFFFSRDLSNLIPLPVKPWQVLGSKFAVVLFYEYLMALPVLLPPVVIYGLGQGAGFFYWLKAAVVVAASPAVPLLISSLLAIVLMRFLNIGKRKDVLAMVGSLLLVVVIIAVNMLTQRIVGSAAQDPAAIARLLADQAGLVNTISAAFPPSAWATLALAGPGAASWLYLLLFAALSAALAALMFWLAGKLYYSTAIMSEESGRRGKPGARGAALAESTGAGPVKALFWREMKLLVRTPAFAMNCLAGSLLIPILIPFSLVQGKGAASQIINLIRDPGNSMTVTFAAVGLMMFVAVINVTASTAFSREGKVFWMSRMIPVEPRTQVWAKFLSSFAVAGAGILLSDIMMAVILKLPLFSAVTALLLGLLATVPVTALNMLPDLMKPKLSWTNPYEAVKQNLNVLTAMLAGLILVGLEVLFVVFLSSLALPEWAVYLAVAALLAVLSFAGLRLLSSASARYYKIEV